MKYDIFDAFIKRVDAKNMKEQTQTTERSGQTSWEEIGYGV